jgi:hypothetical protein
MFLRACLGIPPLQIVLVVVLVRVIESGPIEHEHDDEDEDEGRARHFPVTL